MGDEVPKGVKRLCIDSLITPAIRARGDQYQPAMELIGGASGHPFAKAAIEKTALTGVTSKRRASGLDVGRSA